MSVRVYVPASLDLLATWYAERLVPAGGERYVAPDESEEGEHAALMAAADASAALVGDPGRRVVVVAEVAGEDDEVPWRLLAAVHADPAEVTTSDPEALDEPAWYAVQEVADLLH